MKLRNLQTIALAFGFLTLTASVSSAQTQEPKEAVKTIAAQASALENIDRIGKLADELVF